MVKPETRSLLWRCLEQRVIPHDLTAAQLHELNYAYAKMVHNIVCKLDQCIHVHASKLLEALQAPAEEMLDQPEDAKFRVAHTLLLAGPHMLQQYMLDPLTVLPSLCRLRSHVFPKGGVYLDPLTNLVSWLDLSWQSFCAATPDVQKDRYSILHCYRMESRLMALHDKKRGML